MEKPKSIALISCYIGKLPWYFDYFLLSCSYNLTIDFIIITDDTLWQAILPENVRMIYLTLPEIAFLATQELGFQVSMDYPYKLCDFKPAYGIIFSDILFGYDFWGHTDIDIIFGNIREFITDDLLSKYEVISVRHDWLTGCFLLYKNIDQINTLFKHSRDYKKVFTCSEHFCFDETNFRHAEFTDGKSYIEIKCEIESMTHVVKKQEQNAQLKPFFDFFIIEGLPGKLRWQHGTMTYKSKFEVLFYHLIYFKQLQHGYLPNFNSYSSFRISSRKLYGFRR